LDDPQGSNANCGGQDSIQQTALVRLTVLITVGGVGGDFSQTGCGPSRSVVVISTTVVHE